MDTDPKKDAPPRFIDRNDAPSVYADETAGFGLLSGTVGITFEAAQWDHSPVGLPVARVVVLRLRLPISAAQNLAVGLYDFLAQRGLDPTRKGKNEPVQ